MFQDAMHPNRFVFCLPVSERDQIRMELMLTSVGITINSERPAFRNVIYDIGFDHVQNWGIPMECVNFSSPPSHVYRPRALLPNTISIPINNNKRERG